MKKITLSLSEISVLAIFIFSQIVNLLWIQTGIAAVFIMLTAGVLLEFILESKQKYPSVIFLSTFSFNDRDVNWILSAGWATIFTFAIGTGKIAGTLLPVNEVYMTAIAAALFGYLHEAGMRMFSFKSMRSESSSKKSASQFLKVPFYYLLLYSSSAVFFFFIIKTL